MTADSGMASVTAGSTRLGKPWLPTAGNIGSRNENSCRSSRPIQNVGIETPSGGSASSAPRRRVDRDQDETAAIAPPSSSAIPRAKLVSASVCGNASASSCDTGAPELTETPRSPVTARPSSTTYCSSGGRSNP